MKLCVGGHMCTCCVCNICHFCVCGCLFFVCLFWQPYYRFIVQSLQNFKTELSEELQRNKTELSEEAQRNKNEVIIDIKKGAKEGSSIVLTFCYFFIFLSNFVNFKIQNHKKFALVELRDLNRGREGLINVAKKVFFCDFMFWYFPKFVCLFVCLCFFFFISNHKTKFSKLKINKSQNLF